MMTPEEQQRLIDWPKTGGPCTVCGVWYIRCTASMLYGGHVCCPSCHRTNTHNEVDKGPNVRDDPEALKKRIKHLEGLLEARNERP